VTARAALLLLALAGCPADEPACEPGWRGLADALPGAALSVQGTAADDVWIVGGGLGLGGPLVRRWDGDRWRALDVTAAIGARSLWWVWPETRASAAGGGATGAAWLVGEAGAVVRVAGASGALVDHSMPTAATLYGVWGAAPDDVWIVGGIANGRRDAEDDLVWRWDGAELTPAAGVPARGATLFKVWGSAADDVWISGEGGAMLHWDGATFTDHSGELATLSSVLTVHGCAADDVWAIAGQALYRRDGAAWARRTDVTLGSAANGVACGRERVLVVGNAGLKASLDRATGAWTDDRRAPPTFTDLHGAWIDPAGRAWAVGGNFNQPGATARTGAAGVDGCPAPAPL
jgi:hypothetical protein